MAGHSVKGAVVLVTGANRGLGKAFAEAMLEAGAAKVYAGVRDTASLADSRLVPVQLDITSPADVAAAAERCADLTILVNNAGIMLRSPILGESSLDLLRQELEVNVFGTLAMTRAFAPVLVGNGGGVIVNMLSTASWVTSSLTATYSVSKRGELAITDATRIELRAHGTLVIGVHASFIDTRMAQGVPLPKVSPQQVAERTVAAIESGAETVFADDRTEQLWALLRTNPQAAQQMQQQTWDNRAIIFSAINRPPSSDGAESRT